MLAPGRHFLRAGSACGVGTDSTPLGSGWVEREPRAPTSTLSVHLGLLMRLLRERRLWPDHWPHHPKQTHHPRDLFPA